MMVWKTDGIFGEKGAFSTESWDFPQAAASESKHLKLLGFPLFQVFREVAPQSLHLQVACATLMKLEVAVEPPGGLARKRG